MKLAIFKIAIAVLQSKQVQNGLKNIGYFIGGAFILLVFAIVITINPFAADPTKNPYQIAIEQTITENNIDDDFDAKIMQAIEVELFGEIQNMQVKQIKSRIQKYYLKEITVEFSCLNEQGEDTICIKTEKVFKGLKEIIAALKEDYTITDEAQLNIEVYVNYLNGGSYSGGVPIFNGEFALPTPTGTISCRIGCYDDHIGLDIAVPRSTDVYAIADGVIVYTDTGYFEGDGSGGYGNVVVVAHNIEGVEMITINGHLQDVLVSVGSTVTKGQIIGKSGSTGRSTGPHLHLEIIKNTNTMVWDKGFRRANFVDPIILLKLDDSW